MFWENLLNLCNEKGISPNKLCSELGYSNSIATKWRNGSVPHDRTLNKIAKYFGVPLERLINKSFSSDIQGENIMHKKTKIDLTAMLSEKQLMINKFQTEDFFERLDKNLEVENSREWFQKLNDFSLNDKLSKMLECLGVNAENLFDDMKIVIQTPATTKALALNIHEDAIFPIIVSGKEIFNSISNFSLASLNALEEKLPPQISYSFNSDDNNEAKILKLAKEVKTSQENKDLGLVADVKKSIFPKEYNDNSNEIL